MDWIVATLFILLGASILFTSGYIFGRTSLSSEIIELLERIEERL